MQPHLRDEQGVDSIGVKMGAVGGCVGGPEVVTASNDRDSSLMSEVLGVAVAVTVAWYGVITGTAIIVVSITLTIVVAVGVGITVAQDVLIGCMLIDWVLIGAVLIDCGLIGRDVGWGLLYVRIQSQNRQESGLGRGRERNKRCSG